MKKQKGPSSGAGAPFGEPRWQQVLSIAIVLAGVRVWLAIAIFTGN